MAGTVGLFDDFKLESVTGKVGIWPLEQTCFFRFGSKNGGPRL